jgi:hypothetical protein
MKLTPSQAQSLIPLIQQNPGASITISRVGPDSRSVSVVIGDDAYTIGGRGSVTAA